MENLNSHKEYYWQFMNAVDELMNRFLDKAQNISPDCFIINGIDVKKSIANFLWENLFFSNDRYLFSNYYCDKEQRNKFIELLWYKKLVPMLPSKNHPNVFSEPELFGIIENMVNLLSDFKKSIFFYCKSNRLLKYILPIAKSLKEKVVIISFEELEENLNDCDHIQILEIGIIKRINPNSRGYIKEKYPFHFFVSYTFDQLIQVLHPKSVVFVEGCHYDSELFSAVCKKYSVPTLCLHHGWPALIHTRFINMGYDYYITWGRHFVNLWKIYNPCIKFIDAGYLGEISTNTKSKSGIAFFFQGPLFIIDEKLIKLMADFAIHCATKYSNRIIYIRQHPEFRLSRTIINTMVQLPNIQFVDNLKISELFSYSLIGVGVFSTTLIEGLAHDTIPFIFNITSWPNYYPDLNKLQQGIEVKCIEEAQNKIDKLINNEDGVTDSIQSNIKVEYSNFFTATGKKAVMNTVEIIKTLQ